MNYHLVIAVLIAVLAVLALGTVFGLMLAEALWPHRPLDP